MGTIAILADAAKKGEASLQGFGKKSQAFPGVPINEGLLVLKNEVGPEFCTSMVALSETHKEAVV
jgi:hypothetical protein